MKYVVQPSLKHIALVKVIVMLWDQIDIKALITKLGTLYFSENNKEWQNIEDKISEKVSQLLLPQTLTKKLLGFIKPIGMQILEWRRYHHRGFYLHVDQPAELYWLPQGTVDKKRTAEGLIKDENLDIATRYKLACMYCLEDDIQKLWYQMPENLKGSFSHEDSPGKANWQSVVIFWTRNMKRRESGNAQAHTSYKSAFQFCAKVGNRVAAEYFLQKLTPAERKESLVIMPKFVADAEVLCFLLSEMDEEQQTEVFKFNPFTVLQCFLNWPLQRFFMEVADRVWDALLKQHYLYLLELIFNKVERGYKDWNYEKLFSEFLQKSPITLKSFTADEFESGVLKSVLFKIKDKENLSSILKGVSPIEKKKLIYSVNGRNYCRFLIFYDQWDSLECFFKTCLPLKDERIQFKEIFEKRMKLYLNHFSKGYKWNPLFLLSDDSPCKDSKSEEGGESSSKRLRSTITH